MKRILFLIGIILLSFSAFAQLQKGIVRTAGRMNHHGEVIGDVIIRAEGAQNAVASQPDGTFSIRFHDINEGGVFRLSSIKKLNYEVLDKDLIGRSLAFSSSVPITIVLLDKTQMEAEKREISSRFEKTYADNYNKRVKEIEEQYAKQIISLEQKIEALEETDNLYEKIQSQMNEMVEHYVRTDYDVLDSIDGEINHLIELGEFEKAKEKIQSKGNIGERVQAILKLQEQVAHNEQSIRKLQRQQAQLSAQTQANQDNLLKDLRNLYDIAITDFQIDSAYDLINHMLAIAPNDLETLREAAWFNLNWRASYLTSLRYSQKYLKIAHEQYPDSSEKVILGSRMVAQLYSIKFALDSALEIYKSIVPVLEKKRNDPIFDGWLYDVYNSIGYAYNRNNEFDSALYYYDKAYEELKLHPTKDVEEKSANRSYKYAWIYYGKKVFDKSIQYNQDAIRRYALLKDSDSMAECYRQQSYVYSSMDSVNAALKALYTALNYIPLKVTPRALSTQGNIYSDLSEIYKEQQQYDSALVYINKEMKFRLFRYSIRDKVYIAYRLSRAEIYAALKNNEAALADYNAAINDMLKFHPDDPAWIAICYRDRGKFFEQTGEIQKAIADYQTAIEYFKQDSSSPAWHIPNLQEKIKNLQE